MDGFYSNEGRKLHKDFSSKITRARCFHEVATIWAIWIGKAAAYQCSNNLNKKQSRHKGEECNIEEKGVS